MKKFKISFMLFAFLVLLHPKGVFASINLNVSSDAGVNALRFGRINLPSVSAKEVKVRITSSEGKQYQVFQRISNPLINDRGERLDINTILVASISDSNAAGTLYLQAAEYLGFSDQLVYTSNQNGESDSFKLAYKIDTSRLSKSGYFSGEIMFFVRAISSGAEDREIMNVFLDASSDDLEVKGETSSLAGTISINSDKNIERQEFVTLSFANNYSGKLRVYQEILDPIVNSLNEEIDLNSISFNTSGGMNGELESFDSHSLDRKRTLLYSSDKERDDVHVHFSFDPALLKDIKADIFSGIIRYTVEVGGQVEVIDYTFNAEVLPIFKLLLEYPSGDMSFKKLMPNTPPQLREVLVTVKTNLQRPYAVSQNIAGGVLSSDDGDKLDSDYFKMKQELVDGYRGKIEAADFVSISPGEQPIFYSDKSGSEVQFRVFYKLTPYNTMKAGNYSAAIVYSLGEI